MSPSEKKRSEKEQLNVDIIRHFYATKRAMYRKQMASLLSDNSLILQTPDQNL